MGSPGVNVDKEEKVGEDGEESCCPGNHVKTGLEGRCEQWCRRLGRVLISGGWELTVGSASTVTDAPVQGWLGGVVGNGG